MSSRGCAHLTDDIHQVLDRFRLEYRMTYEEVIGVLTLVMHDIIAEARGEYDED